MASSRANKTEQELYSQLIRKSARWPINFIPTCKCGNRWLPPRGFKSGARCRIPIEFYEMRAVVHKRLRSRSFRNRVGGSKPHSRKSQFPLAVWKSFDSSSNLRLCISWHVRNTSPGFCCRHNLEKSPIRPLLTLLFIFTI